MHRPRLCDQNSSSVVDPRQVDSAHPPLFCKSSAISQSLSRVYSLLQACGVQQPHHFACIHPPPRILASQEFIADLATLSDWLFEQAHPVVFVGATDNRATIRAVCKLTSWYCHDFSQCLSSDELKALMKLSAITFSYARDILALAEHSGVRAIPLTITPVSSEGQYLCDNDPRRGFNMHQRNHDDSRRTQRNASLWSASWRVTEP